MKSPSVDVEGSMVGVDVGGTFTDVFILDEHNGRASVAKVPTTRPDQSAGFLSGIKQHVNDLADIAVVVHGTTAGTNALLERKGAKTGVITTHGLRDVLEMRRRDRPRTWGLRGNFTPVVERQYRIEVPERRLIWKPLKVQPRNYNVLAVRPLPFYLLTLMRTQAMNKPLPKQ